MSRPSSGSRRSRLVGALLLITGVALTLEVAVAQHASTTPAVAAPPRSVEPSSVQLQSTPIWTNTNVGSFSAGQPTTCALEEGTLYCWGSGAFGIRGDGKDDGGVSRAVKVTSTVDFSNNGNVSTVTVDQNHACALEGGIVYCWGNALNGALGDGRNTSAAQLTPLKVPSGGGFSNNGTVSAVSAGTGVAGVITCAVEGTAAGGDARVYCWGRNYGTSPTLVAPTGGFSNNGTVSAISVAGGQLCVIEGVAPQAVLYCPTGPGAPLVRVPSGGGFSNNGTVSAVSVGSNHFCAIEGTAAAADARLYCWSNTLGATGNSQGEVGDGTSGTRRLTPVKVSSTNGFANNGTVSAVALGGLHSCAIEGVAPNATLYCWGWNSYGQLGNGTTTRSLSPVKVIPGDGFTNSGGVVAVEAASHTCAAEQQASTVELYCWGLNERHQLGDGGASVFGTNRSTPVRVVAQPLPPATPSITGITRGFGRLSVAFSPSGSGSGASDYQYSLDGGATWITRSPASTASPLVITGLTNGTTYDVQLRAVNNVGTTSATPSVSASPTESWTTNNTASHVAQGGSHSCALSDGMVYCWGSALGSSSQGVATQPTWVAPSAGMSNTGTVSAVAAGGNHSCVIEGTSPNAVLYCWGSNSHGQLGDGTTTDRSSAVRVSPGGGFSNNGTVSAVALGEAHTCALEGTVAGGDARLYCWGDQEFGRLGNGTVAAGNVTTAALVLGGGGFSNNGTVSAVAAGDQHTCAIEGGAVFCWGANGSGQLGDGTTTPTSSAVQVSPGAGFSNNGTVSALGTGGQHTCAIEGGAVFCWGNQEFGRLGNGTVAAGNVTTAALVLGGAGFSNNGTVSALGTGGQHTCAIEGGAVFCWGVNGSGQLGDGTTTPTSSAVQVSPGGGFSNNGTVSALGAGGQHTCAIEGGAVFCWGANGSGQLGDGTTTHKTSPTLLSAVDPVVTGQAFTVPTAPTITGITAGDGQLSVAFTAPSSDGGNPVSNYEYSLDGGPTWVTRNPASTASPLVITGLTNDTSYTVLLRAVNAAGPGSASGGSSGTPRAAVGIPAPVTTTAPSTPSDPAPQGPTVVRPTAPNAQPQLIGAQDAPRVRQSPGSAGLVVDGEAVELEVMSLNIPSARVEPEDRTPAQVAAVQRAGAALLDEFNALTPAGESPLATVTNTPTGAVVNGVLVDPRDGRTPITVPVEDVVLVSSPEIRVLLAAASADAVPEMVTRGVVRVRPSGVVAALAHGFDPSTPGEVVVFSTPTLLGAFTTDTNGTFTGQMTLPPDIEPGEHTLVLITGTATTSLGLLIDGEGNAVIEDPTTPADSGDDAVPTPDPGAQTLPATGTGSPGSVLAVAVFMMLLGIVILRRRPV